MVRDRDYRVWMEAATQPPAGRIVGQFFEEVIQDIYEAILRLGEMAVDCGANRGVHTMPMSAAVGLTGEVLAIEALPTLAEDLSRKFVNAGCANVTVMATAVGAHEGPSSFSWVQASDGYSGLRKQPNLPDGTEATVTEIEVPITTLDRLLSGRTRRVRFVKMDLEGGEFDALRGGAQMLRTNRPLIVFENAGERTARLYCYAREDWFIFFDDMNYATFDLFGRPFSSQDSEAEYGPWNFIAAPKGGEDESFIRNVLGSRIAALHAYVEVAAAQREIDQLRSSTVGLSAARDQIAAEPSAVYHSRSWRITGPLRSATSCFDKLKHRLGSAARS